MPSLEPKADLREYLHTAREVMLWKLDGLTEYDMRRPLVPTGTNLLGLVRHAGTLEAGYLGSVFGWSFAEVLPWMEDGEPNGDMWVRAGEATHAVIDFCRRAWAHADATIDALPLDAVGEVPWWPENDRQLSLHLALVHVTTDLYRHAGHADVLRELIDGSAGADPRWSNLPPGDEAWWCAYRNKVEAAALETDDAS